MKKKFLLPLVLLGIAVSGFVMATSSLSPSPTLTIYTDWVAPNNDYEGTGDVTVSGMDTSKRYLLHAENFYGMKGVSLDGQADWAEGYKLTRMRGVKRSALT